MAATEEANSERGSNRGSGLLFRMERERSCTLTVLGHIYLRLVNRCRWPQVLRILVTHSVFQQLLEWGILEDSNVG